MNHMQNINKEKSAFGQFSKNFKKRVFYSGGFPE